MIEAMGVKRTWAGAVLRDDLARLIDRGLAGAIGCQIGAMNGHRLPAAVAHTGEHGREGAGGVVVEVAQARRCAEASGIMLERNSAGAKIGVDDVARHRGL
jgi:hypothetical protein